MGSASLVLVKVPKANTPVPFVPLLRNAKRSETGVFVATRTRCSMCLAQVVHYCTLSPHLRSGLPQRRGRGASQCGCRARRLGLDPPWGW